ncbi:phage repressor protein [Natronolimnohabitans sp. A-GB9]|uniref:winged-helix domain-containing protein n=1 Tax=Natronolimnohabitans sp. A-GB9 TaxID=3069757 RepID=UPI0027ADAA15|nr:winged-helix domain-containing protein [Natronolimnohabitans sp. A-GB9]MDQ2052708.1 phage repressor protein [Natronolimnohabitans sp. A-GB9]
MTLPAMACELAALVVVWAGTLGEGGRESVGDLGFPKMHDLELPAKSLYRNPNRHRYEIGYLTVRQRLSVLEEHGLIENVDEDGYYDVTEKGPAYLEGEPGVDDLE